MSELGNLLKPARRWPLAIYGMLAASLWVATVVLLQLGNFEIAELTNVFFFMSFATVLALVAMSRASMSARIKVFVVILVLKMGVTLCEELLSLFRYPGGFPVLHAYEWMRLSLKDLREFAMVFAMSQGLSSLTFTVIALRSRASEDVASPIQARLSDWFYFMVFIGLALIAPLPYGTLTMNADRELVFTIVQNSFGREREALRLLLLIPTLGVAASGLFCLASFSQWRIALFAHVVNLALSALCIAFLADSGPPLLLVFAAVTIASMLSVPYWLLLWLTGYRLHSPRRSLFSKPE